MFWYLEQMIISRSFILTVIISLSFRGAYPEYKDVDSDSPYPSIAELNRN